MSVNRVILLGHAGRDPEVRYTASGAAVASISVATNETFKDREGNRQERTEWHRVIAWGKLAEIAGEYLRKGREVYVEGRLQTRKWTDREGTERYSTEIIAERLRLIGGRGAEPAEGGDKARATGNNGYDSRPADDFDDDIPFD